MMQCKELHQDVERVLIGEAELSVILDRLASQINDEYQGEPLLLVVILKGSVVFATDLMRRLDMPVSLDFMQTSSYGVGSTSSGFINIKRDLDEEVAGKNVLVVEDIIDSGNTLKKLKELLQSRNPKSVKICTLLDKPERRVTDVAVEFVGKQIPDEFVVGYGLDFAERYRNLPYVGILRRSVYE